MQKTSTPKRLTQTVSAIKTFPKWIKLLTDRNQTAHLYDEQAAAEIYDLIVSHHVDSFKQLLNEIKKY